MLLGAPKIRLRICAILPAIPAAGKRSPRSRGWRCAWDSAAAFLQKKGVIGSFSGSTQTNDVVWLMELYRQARSISTNA